MPKTIIIVGNGPSLKTFNFANIRGHDSFVLNGFFKKFPDIAQLGFTPTYYGLLDDYTKRPWTYEEINPALKEYCKVFKQMFFFSQESGAITKCFNSYFIDLVLPTVIPYETRLYTPPAEEVARELSQKLSLDQYKLFETTILNSPIIDHLTAEGIRKFIQDISLSTEDFLHKPRFRPDFLLPNSLTDFIYNNGNAATVACQIAMCLGYNKIVLIGVDCKWTKKQGGYYSTQNHWFGDYYPNSFYDATQYSENGLMDANYIHLAKWKSFKEAIEYNKSLIDIVNCTPDSDMTYFRMSTLEEEI